jgi:large subunit ribosomal protein L31e
MPADEEDAVESNPEAEAEGEAVAEGEETGEIGEEEETEEIEEEIGEAEEEVLEESVEEEFERETIEEGIVEERIYTIPLSKAWVSPRKKRAPRAIRIIKGFITRHMKPESISISDAVNKRIWSRGIEKPPRRIRIRAAKDEDGKVSVYLAEAD